MTPETLKAQIRAAFAEVRYPGDHRLRNSSEGDEPFGVERDFRGKRDWRTPSAKFLDGAPDGAGSALSFFSHEAFRFYLPAYLTADIDGRLGRATPVFHLTHGLDERSRRKKINPQRYGGKNWFEHVSERFSAFTREEATAIVSYLTFKRDLDDCGRDSIDQAIMNYWRGRAAAAPSI